VQRLYIFAVLWCGAGPDGRGPVSMRPISATRRRLTSGETILMQLARNNSRGWDDRRSRVIGPAFHPIPRINARSDLMDLLLYL
jgi:hypothetical protein